MVSQSLEKGIWTNHCNHPCVPFTIVDALGNMDEEGETEEDGEGIGRSLRRTKVPQSLRSSDGWSSSSKSVKTHSDGPKEVPSVCCD
jgi:hypothetical protein